MSRHGSTPSSQFAAPAVGPRTPGQRLQKILAAAGLGSRRQCEELIVTGRVEVNRQVVTALGTRADLDRQEVRVDGVALARPKLVHYLIHKPVGILSTNRDPSGRPRVVDLLPPQYERLFTVGRLDMSSEGLILATNDGELANRLAHPRYGVEKTYHVEVAGSIQREDMARLRSGVFLAEGFARVVSVRVKSRFKQSTLLEIVLDEGRNREIRRLLARIGHKVLRLKRVALGPLRLGELPPGAYRPLDHDEVRQLWQASTPGARRRRLQDRGKAKSHRKPAGSSPAVGERVGKAALDKPTRPVSLPRRPTVIGATGMKARKRPKPRRPVGTGSRLERRG